MLTTNGTYPWSFVTQIFHNGQPSHGGYRDIFEVMTSTLPKRNPLSYTIFKEVHILQGLFSKHIK